MRVALKAVTQNDGDFVDLILLYGRISPISDEALCGLNVQVSPRLCPYVCKDSCISNRATKFLSSLESLESLESFVT